MFTRIICCALAVTGAVVALGLTTREAETPARTRPPKFDKPNIILISIDTLRADHLGCYGYSKSTSPRLDALARQGVRFENAFSQASWTLPSHMSIMTSQYPHVHGVQEAEQTLADGVPTLAEALSANGYATAAFISWVFLGEKYGFARGFDEYTELLPPPDKVDSSTDAAFKANEVTARAIDWLSQDRSEPFMLFLHYFDPHINYDPPATLARLYDSKFEGTEKGTFGRLRPYIKGLHHRPDKIDPEDLRRVTALYDGEIRYTDTHLGRLFDAVEATVGLDNCIIVVTSDHGEEFNEHGSMEGHQWTLYDEVIRVPFIMRLPGGAYAGRVIPRPVESIDISTTILGCLGIDPPPTFQGRDHSMLIAGGESANEPAVAYGEIRRFNRKQYVRDANYKLIHTDDIGRNKRGIPVTPGYELYDLRSDPGEQRNIFHPESEVALHMIELLEQHREDYGVQGTSSPGSSPVRLSGEDLKRLQSLGYVASH